jgi:hypothetical protein
MGESVVHAFERLPAALRHALLEVFGAAAADVRIVERSWRVRWHRRAIATTRPDCIYLRDTLEDFTRDPAVVLHEYFHVLSQWRAGRLTRLRYVIEWLRRGYLNNRFEIEAREFEAANLRHFYRLMARTGAAGSAQRASERYVDA